MNRNRSKSVKKQRQRAKKNESAASIQRMCVTCRVPLKTDEAPAVAVSGEFDGAGIVAAAAGTAAARNLRRTARGSAKLVASPNGDGYRYLESHKSAGSRQKTVHSK